MPRRTNDFQRLVEMIQRAFAPKGAKVTESAPIPGRGRFREVDVLFEGSLGPYSLKIAIEATKTGRKLDGPGIEKFIGKYHGSDIDKVVVVASGFTREARTRAAEARIQLWTLIEAERSDWVRLAPTKFQLHLPPHVCKIATVPATNAEHVRSAEIICGCCGKSKGTLTAFGERVLRTQVLQNPELIGMMNQLVEQNNGVASFNLNLPFKNHKLKVGDRDQELSEVAVRVHYIRGVGDAIWSTYRIEDGSTERTVDHMEVKVGGKHVKVVFPSGSKSPQIILRIDDDETFAPKAFPSDFNSKTFNAMPWNQSW